MDITQEIEALKKVVDSLTPLDEAARFRVIEYASKMLNLSSHRELPSPRFGSGSKPNDDPKIKRTGKPVGPQEYLRNFDYKIMTKKIAVLAVYLEREKGEKRFNFKAITDAFRDAKEPKMPAHSQYGRAVAMNYLAKDGDVYYATSQAEALVDGYKSNPVHGKTEEDE